MRHNENVMNFTTTEADQDIYDEFIRPQLRTVFGYSDASITSGIFLDIRILFDNDYTGDIEINGVTTKADAKATIRVKDIVTSIVIETSGTVGQVKITT